MSLVTTSFTAGSTATTLGEMATTPWSTPYSDALTSDGVYSIANIYSIATTETLVLTNFGFAVPTGATITGVQVNILRQCDTASNASDYDLRLYSSSAKIGTSKADTTTKYPTTAATASYGSASDLWGATLTPAIVNATGFGIALQCQGTPAGFPSVGIDSILISISYVTSNPTGVAATGSAGTLFATNGNSGTLSGSANALSSTGATWSNAGNIYTVNSSEATSTISGNGTSQIITVSGFGLSLPSWVSIAGFEVIVTRRNSAGGTMTDSMVQLYDGSAQVGTNKADTSTAWPTTSTGKTYGSPTDMWGTTLTASQISTSGFGVSFRATCTTTLTCRVDAVQLKVYYSTAQNGSGSLTGVSSSTALGTIIQTVTSSVGVTGIASSGNAGTVSTNIVMTANVTGAQATGSAGSLLATVSNSQTITGNASTSSAGIVNKTVSSFPSGVVSTGNVGTLTETVASSALPTGNAASGNVGALSETVTSSPSMVGVNATGNTGNAISSTVQSQALTGNPATGSVGLAVGSVPLMQNVTGVQGTGGSGSLTPSLSQAILGNSGTGSLGTLLENTTANALLTGINGSGSAGTLIGSNAVNALAVGANSNGGTGTLTPSTLQSQNIAGVNASGQSGSILGAASYNKTVTGNASVGSSGLLAANVFFQSVITGNQSMTAIGSLSDMVSSMASLIGVQSVGTIGSVFAGNGAAIPLQGNSGSGNVGTLLETVTSLVSILGASSALSAGSLSAGIAQFQNLTGNATIGLIGTLQTTNTGSIILGGIQSSLSAGLIGYALGALRNIIGVSSIGSGADLVATGSTSSSQTLIGVFSASAVGVFGKALLPSLSGVFGTGNLGNLTTISDASFPLSGVNALTGLGSLGIGALASKTLHGTESIADTTGLSPAILKIPSGLSSSASIGTVSTTALGLGTAYPTSVVTVGSLGAMDYTNAPTVILMSVRSITSTEDLETFGETQNPCDEYDCFVSDTLQQIQEFGCAARYEMRKQTANPNKPWIETSETIQKYDVYVFIIDDVIQNPKQGGMRQSQFLTVMMGYTGFIPNIGDTFKIGFKQYTVIEPIEILAPSNRPVLFNLKVAL